MGNKPYNLAPPSLRWQPEAAAPADGVDDHGYCGGVTMVKDYVRIARDRQRESFVPLSHPPGHSQVDFGETILVIGGVIPTCG